MASEQIFTRHQSNDWIQNMSRQRHSPPLPRSRYTRSLLRIWMSEGSFCAASIGQTWEPIKFCSQRSFQLTYRIQNVQTNAGQLEAILSNVQHLISDLFQPFNAHFQEMPIKWAIKGSLPGSIQENNFWKSTSDQLCWLHTDSRCF